MRSAAAGLALLAVTAGRAQAQVCLATASGLAFGLYDPFATSAAAITGTVTVTCQATTAVSVNYSIQLGAGTGGSFAARSMGGLVDRLPYQLYTSAALTQVWGDGSGGTGVIGDSYALAALGSASRSYTAYGRIPPRQVIRPGIYTDLVAVLIVY